MLYVLGRVLFVEEVCRFRVGDKRFVDSNDGFLPTVNTFEECTTTSGTCLWDHCYGLQYVCMYMYHLCTVASVKGQNVHRCVCLQHMQLVLCTQVYTAPLFTFVSLMFTINMSTCQ